ncbi:hypothetical protein C0J50_9478 [Silurus asotus]|uniref:Uncharacterized protein n=1 Tax=Silurus asotus TaxID=30991 RepID=A0AAD5A3W7_SILAS|nr:hypothetical protein C0J50_9478 [Silurus asotus]
MKKWHDWTKGGLQWPEEGSFNEEKCRKLKDWIECWEEGKKEKTEKVRRKQEIVDWFEKEGKKRQKLDEPIKEKEKRKPPCNCQIDCYCKTGETASERKQERENVGTAPPWEKCGEQQKPPQYNEKSPGYISGLYPQLPYSNETPGKVTLELTGGMVEGFIRSAYRTEPNEGEGVTKNERSTTNVRTRQNKAKGKSRFKKE